MAAGRRGGYLDHEVGEAEFEGFKRIDYNYTKEDYGTDRERSSCDRDHGSSAKARVRQRDMKEREIGNGGYHSSSCNAGNRRNGPNKPNGYHVRMVDREPGELSSGSGSDDLDVSEARHVDDENSKSQNGVQPQTEKKRKFSPIVWDREERATKVSSMDKTDPPGLLPPASVLPQFSSSSPHHNLSESEEAVLRNTSLRQLEPSPIKLHKETKSAGSAAVSESAGSAAVESLTRVSPTLPMGQLLNNEQETVQIEEEHYISTRNISASRWADQEDSPRDEGEISDQHGSSKRRREMHSTEFVESRLKKKTPSPELGELTREGSEGAQTMSSESHRGGCHSGPVSEDEVELEKNDFAEVDEKDGNADISGHLTDSQPSVNNDSCGSSLPVVPPQRSINMLQGCRSVNEFERLNKIDEGTYGVVYRAKDKRSGEIVALKKVKMEKEREGFPLTSLREINILLSFHHPSIVDVREVVVGSSLDSIFMVMEYMEHDLKGLMETMKQPFSQSEVKCLMLQLLEGLKYLHDNWVLHRDLKTSNILLNNRGELKICDFGLARQYGSPLKPYTHLVVTLWYRAPELLLGSKEYSTAIDMWSLGCIMAELLGKEPLFSGKNEIDQIHKIFKTLGTPNEKIWPGFAKLPGVKVNYVRQPYNMLREKFPPTSFSGRPTLSEAGFDLLNKLLSYDPEKRITADAALNHGWFNEVPLPKSKDFMPTFPAQHAQDRRLRRIMKSPDPLEEQRRKELRQGELVGTGGLFG